MVIHPYAIDRKGAGRWHAQSKRYIPMGGGSRMLVPISDGEATYNRYPGFLGLDEKLTEGIALMQSLYDYLGGASAGTGQAGEWAEKIREVTGELRRAEEEERTVTP